MEIKMRKLSVLLIVVALLAVFVVPTFAQDDMGTIADIVVASATGDEPEFTTLLAAVQAADPSILEALSSEESDLTVFAPTDAAFEAVGAETLGAVLADQDLLNSILLFHVVSEAATAEEIVGMLGEMDGSFSYPTLNGQYINVAVDDMGVSVNGAHVVTTDIMASNGIIHVIDAVILPESRTIAEIVVESASAEEPQFSTLLAAVQAADPAVLELLSDPEAELTVFAPTDAAFAAVGEETLATVLADQALLTSILQYHVLTSKVYSLDAIALLGENDGSVEVESASGATFTLSVSEDGNAMINQATIIITDIDASNGVIHVIDAVILPPSE
jgi:uncharacterized surface protein with fasciclin (FAS1) repeats